MSAFLHQIVYEFRSGLRDKSLLLMNYLFPLLFFALVGGLMAKVNPGFTPTMIPAMSLFALMCSSLLSSPSSLVAARDSGLLRSYRINGVPAWAALAAPPLANLAHMVLATAAIAAAGRLAFGAPLPADWAWFALSWFASWAALAGLGALIGTLSPSPRAAILVSQLVYIPSIILGGLMVPASALPDGLAAVSRLFPASHAMRAFSGAGAGAAPLAAAALPSLVLLLAGAALAFGVSLALYEWDQKNARPQARKLLALVALLPYAASMLLR